MPNNESGQNIWFGVAMFLGGLIAGVVLSFASGSLPAMKQGSPTAPNPQVPNAPQASVEDRMIAFAADVGVDEGDFEKCLTTNNYKDKVMAQMGQGQSAGVSGTPGNIVYDLASKKGILVSGAQPVANFKTHIDAMLKDPAGALKQPGVQLAQTVTPVDFATDHVRGNTATAKVAVIEYSDYQCPYCKNVHPTYEQLMKDYDGEIVWIYRHFPLTSIHPDAMPLALGAECVNELAGPDAFWKFSDKVMKS